uniref:Rhophilin Rho GTPase binding protein 1 n=1 Tax=Hippocampus comes TaxID=109280 RepID=A0A3Q2XKV6_HIPCM
LTDGILSSGLLKKGSRARINQQINKEMRMRAGAENLFRATTNTKVKETVALELSYVNSSLQLLKEELEDLNSNVEVYQTERSRWNISVRFPTTLPPSCCADPRVSNAGPRGVFRASF